MRRVLAERGANVDVELLIDAPSTPEWDELAYELHQAARESTPLPMSGEVPDWTQGNPAAALRRAGLTYAARARAVAQEEYRERPARPVSPYDRGAPHVTARVGRDHDLLRGGGEAFVAVRVSVDL